jgi:hypothetical protein
MPPLRANYSYEGLKQELSAIGIVVLEVFPDGQVRWGDSPMPTKPGEKFKGRSVMTAPYMFFDGNKARFDIFTIRSLVERLGKVEHLPQLEKALEQYGY